MILPLTNAGGAVYRHPMTSAAQRISILISILLHLSALALYAATSLERMIQQELNVVRTNPAAYVEHLKHYRALFQGRSYRQPGTEQLIHTEEGIAAIDEAIAVLQRQQPVPALKWDDGLVKSGAELVRAQQKSGKTGHGKGKGGMERRIMRHGKWAVAIGENVTYGPYLADRGRDVVAQLIVDDGVPDRGHRENIFNPQFRLVGVACGPHPTYEVVCVIDFAGGRQE